MRVRPSGARAYLPRREHIPSGARAYLPRRNSSVCTTAGSASVDVSPMLSSSLRRSARVWRRSAELLLAPEQHAHLPWGGRAPLTE